MKKIITGIKNIYHRASSYRWQKNLEYQVKAIERQTIRRQKMLAWLEKHMPNSRITSDLRFDIKMMEGAMPADLMLFSTRQ